MISFSTANLTERYKLSSALPSLCKDNLNSTLCRNAGAEVKALHNACDQRLVNRTQRYQRMQSKITATIVFANEIYNTKSVT